MRFWMIFLAGLAFAAAFLVYLPLSPVLNATGLAGRGMSWQAARGTVWNGEVAGLAYQGGALGTARIKASPLGLLTGQFRGSIQIDGPAAQGRAKFSAGLGSLKLTDGRARFDLSSAPGLLPEVRANGGVITVELATLQLVGDRCRAASGSVKTDALQLAGVRAGRQWPDMTGPVACEAGRVRISLRGESSKDEIFEVEARLLPNVAYELTASVRGGDADLEARLALYGFAFENGAYVYRYDSRAISGD